MYDLYGNFRRSFKYIEGEDSSSRWKTEIFYDPIYNFDQNNLICHDNSNGRNFVGKGSNLQVDVEEIYFGLFLNKMEELREK